MSFQEFQSFPLPLTIVQQPEEVPLFTHIFENEFFGRKQKKLNDDDIAICECKYISGDPESACGERCLNVLTSTECTPGYCPCGNYCKNQRFQNCQYAKTKLFKTEGRGWGLLADQDIKAGQFIIEYCGEVISFEEARQRSQNYEDQGLRDAYIISLNANEFIDATKKGTLARFINHSCLPNCETRKWTVLGETRVGIFARQDISAGTELAYNYNFEWYGGATVRCLCGAANCSIFLGAKSHGFQEFNHVWEEGDDRYRVEEIPLYDSAEDEPFLQVADALIPFKSETTSVFENDGSVKMEVEERSEFSLESFTGVIPQHSVAMESLTMKPEKVETDVGEFYGNNIQPPFLQTNAIIPCVRSNSEIGLAPTTKKKSQHMPKKKMKSSSRKPFNIKNVARLFALKEVQEEVCKYEEIKTETSSKLSSLYNEIRPAIEEHERDTQDSVPTSVAEMWIGANCSKMKADFDFHFSIVKNFLCSQKSPMEEVKSLCGSVDGGDGFGDDDDGDVTVSESVHYS